ncbi:MAG: PqqD family protein [Oscillospiraceae bacterium]|nr:PqqD family protein [Oscillospiraceae bacterium]
MGSLNKKKKDENYLEKIPRRPEALKWTQEDDGMVTLQVENKGLFNKAAQKLLKKPAISYIHLDEIGSFVWPLIDGEKSIIDIGVSVEEHFGEKVKPTYERLAKYFQMLDNCGFVEWVNKLN